LKLAENLVEIDQSADLQSAGFGFDFNAKMADMLSNKIYSDPILAVVREYICNAVDAHGQLPVNRAIDVGFPTTIDPTWWVRDYGSGLSQEQIMGKAPDFRGLFNTYGRSNKSDSNAAIGGFGLGSKAGFAYIKRSGAFTVTSWHGGEKKIYTCHMSEKGIPSVTLMSSAPSTEPNGIKIAVPVKREDHSTFSDRTLKTIKYMTQEFKLYGNTHTVKKPEYQLSKDNWGIVQDYAERSKVIMGGIAYPIDTSQFKHDSLLSRVCVHIYAPIGSVELSVSREALSYESTTINYLNTQAEIIRGSIAAEAEKNIQEQPSLIEASRKYHEFLNRTLAFVFNGKDIKWKGKYLLYYAPRKSSMYYQGHNHGGSHSLNAKKDDTFWNVAIDFHQNFNSYDLQLRDRNWCSSTHIYVSNDYTFCYVPPGMSMRRKIASLLKDAQDNKTTTHYIFVKTDSYKRFLHYYLKSGRHNKFIKAEDIVDYKVPSVPKNYKSPKDGKRDITRYSDHYSSNRAMDNYVGVNVDFKDTTTKYYYVPTKKYKPYEAFSNLDEAKAGNYEVINKWPSIKKLLGLTIIEPLYAVPFTHKTLALANPNFINVFELIEKKLAAAAKDQKLIDEMELFYRRNDDVKYVKSFHSFLDYLVKNYPKVKDTFVKKFIDNQEQIKGLELDKISVKITELNTLSSFLGKDLDSFDKLKPSGKQAPKVLGGGEFRTYIPLLKHIPIENLEQLSKDDLNDIYTLIMAKHERMEKK